MWPVLIDALKGCSSPKVAADELAKIGRSVMPLLLKALADKDPRVRAGAAEALGQMVKPPLLASYHAGSTLRHSQRRGVGERSSAGACGTRTGQGVARSGLQRAYPGSDRAGTDRAERQASGANPRTSSSRARTNRCARLRWPRSTVWGRARKMRFQRSSVFWLPTKIPVTAAQAAQVLGSVGRRGGLRAIGARDRGQQRQFRAPLCSRHNGATVAALPADDSHADGNIRRR